METFAPSPGPTSTPPLLSQSGVIAVSTVGSAIVLIVLLIGLWFNRKVLWKKIKGGKRTIVVPVNVDMDVVIPVFPPAPAQQDRENQNVRKSQQSDLEKTEEDEVVRNVISDKPTTREIPKTPPAANPHAESPTTWEKIPPEELRTKPTNDVIAESPSRLAYHAAQAAKKVSYYCTTQFLNTDSFHRLYTPCNTLRLLFIAHTLHTNPGHNLALT